jgi:hypothetical protein
VVAYKKNQMSTVASTAFSCKNHFDKTALISHAFPLFAPPSPVPGRFSDEIYRMLKNDYKKNNTSTDRGKGGGTNRARVTRGSRNPKHGKGKALHWAEKPAEARKIRKLIFAWALLPRAGIL